MIFLLKFIFLLFFVSDFALSETPECGEGWSYYPSTGFCYGVNKLPQRSTWENAENYCQTLGGAHLVTINSLAEYQQIMSYFSVAWDNTWTGYYTPSVTSYDPLKWIAIDGSAGANFLKFGRWCNVFRWGGWINPAGGKRCLAIGYDQEKPCFFDVDCTVITMRVICKKSPPKTASADESSKLVADLSTKECGNGWSYFPSTGFCYGVDQLPQRSTWTNAENYCQSLGGHLFTINSKEEYLHFSSYFYVLWDNTWTGYYTPSGTNFDATKWIGVDGKVASFLKYGKWCNTFRWGTHVQPVGGKRCLGFGYDQQKPCFFDVDCTLITMKVICKRAPKTTEIALKSEIPISSKYICDEGWTYFEQTGFCIGLNQLPQDSAAANWINAENKCQSFDGGHLFTINSLEEYQTFMSYAYVGLLANTWTGYYTESGTTFDATKWIGVDGRDASFLNNVKWCNRFRWGFDNPPVGGKRCLAVGFDEDKPCFFDVDCTVYKMRILCKRAPKESEKVISKKILFEELETSEVANWINAENKCQSFDGAHLFTINSLEEYQTFMSYAYVGLLANIWTGYYTESGTTFDATKWIGVDGTKAGFLNNVKWCNRFRWGFDNPPVGGKRCLAFGFDEDKPCFFDVDCTVYKMRILCKRAPKEILFEELENSEVATSEVVYESFPECGNGWTYFMPTGFCYGVDQHPQKRTWSNAENYCQSMGGHLVTVNSVEEYRHFLSYSYFMVFHNIWMGYYTPSGTTYDGIKWFGVDGIEANFLKYGRWCNMYRWTEWIKPSAGKKCLGFGFDQEKPCLFEVDCESLTMNIICKRPSKTKPTTKIITRKPSTLPTQNSLTIPTLAVIPPRNTCHV